MVSENGNLKAGVPRGFEFVKHPLETRHYAVGHVLIVG